MAAIAWGVWGYIQKNPSLLESIGFHGGVVNKQTVQDAIKQLSSGISKNLTSLTTPVSFQTDSAAVLPGPLSHIDTNTTSGSAITRTGIVSNTNNERSKQSLHVLSENTQLDNSAQVKAQDILTRHYFEHTAPDGTTSSDLASTAGYQYLIVGENLALGNFISDADVVTAWMNSPGHRANILRADYKDIGVGVAQGQYDGHLVWVVVQHFGRPRTDCPLIDNSLKSEITAGDKEVASIVTTLENLKTQVEEGRAQGKDMNTEVDSYNEILASYSAKFAALNKLRTTYNDEVRAFNACLSAVQTSLGGH